MFGALGIALKYQRKVLFWGILGAIVMRGVFIFAGVSVLERFEWVMYLFGALLLYTAFRMLRSHGVKVDPQRNHWCASRSASSPSTPTTSAGRSRCDAAGADC